MKKIILLCLFVYLPELEASEICKIRIPGIRYYRKFTRKKLRKKLEEKYGLLTSKMKVYVRKNLLTFQTQKTDCELVAVALREIGYKRAFEAVGSKKKSKNNKLRVRLTEP